MTQENLISVIIPAYNVEKYLSRCVQSVVEQSYRNLEIILIDDGSPDNCGKICDQWQKKDSRIKVIHKKNGGLSSARNAGLEIAAGNFIGFIDSDDYISPNMYEKLFELMIESNSDVSMCEYWRVDEDGNIIPRGDKIMDSEIISGDIALCKAVSPEYSRDYIIVWNKLYRAEIFSALRFPDGYLHEDEFISPKILYSCKKVAITSEKLYFYTVRKSSLMGYQFHAKFDAKSFHYYVKVFQDRYNFLIGIGKPELAKFALRDLHGVLIGALKVVNYLQYKKEFSGVLGDTLRKLFRSENFNDKVRAFRLCFLWLVNFLLSYAKAK